jgi:EmrB/QacA subfamily drug resistance transporter
VTAHHPEAGRAEEIRPLAAMPEPGPRRRWWVLAILGAAQLMVVLDNTIVNVALPSAQASLGFGTDGRPWIVTAYALTFGALLLPGGRVSDMLGCRRAFIIGLAGFAGASAVGGAATGFTMLVAARAVQGAFGALLAPTVLSLMTITFPGGRTRAKAFGILSAITASGAVIGLILGGFLTEYLSWRWTMYINTVFAFAAIVGGLALLERGHEVRRARIDLPSAVLSGAGLLGIVFGFARAPVRGWSAGLVAGSLAGGVVLLSLFVLRQRSAASPLLPLRVLRDRARAAAYVSRFTASAGNFAVIFFLTFILQENFGLSPLLTGVAAAPMAIGIVSASNLLGARLLPRLGPRPIGVTGLLLSAASLAWLARLGPSTSYWTGILVPLYLFGAGQGLTTIVAMSTATLNLEPQDVGVASATVNVMQQVGGSLGTALLSSIAATTTAAYLGAHPGQHSAAVLHGDDIAFAAAAALFTAAVIAFAVLTRAASRQAGRARP